MSGLRIHHPEMRNCLLIVSHPGEIKRGFRTINKGRRPKYYRLALDADGNCIVSETVWKRLQEAKAPFIVLNEVTNPPTQTLSFKEQTVETPAVYQQMQNAVRQLAPPGVTTYIRRHDG